MKTLAVCQSGGPTPVINSSLCGVIEAAFDDDNISTVLGVKNGVEGLFQEKIVNLNLEDKQEISYLKQTPGSALGTCRYKLKSEEEIKKAFDILKKYSVDYFIYIGGNDSMDTVDKMSKYAMQNDINIKVMGVSKTIDNDLPITDHTPGFPSAAKYIINSVAECGIDLYSYDKEGIVIIETMGRHAGWLTASAHLAKKVNANIPDLIYMPEVTFDANKFIEDVKEVFTRKKQVVIVASEGIKDSSGEYISSITEVKDQFGHITLGGTSDALTDILQRFYPGMKIRSIELSLLQRACSHIGCKTDVEEAYMCGYTAVKEAVKGNSGQMVGIKRISSLPYKSEPLLLHASDVANVEKAFPSEWIINGNSISDDFYDYLYPLVNDNIDIVYENGVIRFAKLKFIPYKI